MKKTWLLIVIALFIVNQGWAQTAREVMTECWERYTKDVETECKHVKLLIYKNSKGEGKPIEKELNHVNNNIITANESIHTLKAEWSYLNTPSRLNKLNNKFLKLKPFYLFCIPQHRHCHQSNECFL